MLPSLPIEPEPRVIPATPPHVESLNDFGGVLSPSQVRTFRDCGAKWYYKYALGLPDPPNGSLVRGRVVHQMAETFFRAKLDGGSPDPDDLQASFEEAWDTAAAQAAFGADEDVDLLKRQAANAHAQIPRRGGAGDRAGRARTPRTRRYRRRTRARVRRPAGCQRTHNRPEDGRAQAYRR